MSQLAYTLEENIRRIKMDKNTKYLVLEGVDDISKYENVVKQMVIDVDFFPISLGCKAQVLKLLSEVNLKNFIAVVDRDFVNENLPTDPRLILLSRYSIENFVLSQQVLNALVANLVKEPEANVTVWFDFSEWASHTFESLKGLLVTLHFYQTQVQTNRKPWNKAEFDDSGTWKISSDKVSNLVSELFDGNVPDTAIQEHDSFRQINQDEFLRVFPGKLLLKSIYLFIRDSVYRKFGNATKLNGIVPNVKSFESFSSLFVSRNPEFRSDMAPVLAFMTS